MPEFYIHILRSITSQLGSNVDSSILQAVLGAVFFMTMLTQEENNRRQRDWVITFACLGVISTSFVALRLFVKLKIVRNFGVDDIASVAASVSYHFS